MTGHYSVSPYKTAFLPLIVRIEGLFSTGDTEEIANSHGENSGLQRRKISLPVLLKKLLQEVNFSYSDKLRNRIHAEGLDVHMTLRNS